MRGLRLAATILLLLTFYARADEPVWNEAQKRHWSFVPAKRPPLPAIERSRWVRNPIDAFVLRGLEESKLSPTSEAGKLTLLRRLRFDLTGLPPTPEEAETFLADKRSDAYERLVDRLLASPQYGERWATPWLDLARYSESDGFKSDKTRPNAWRYRDWLVKALNDDMPYDQFVRLQLAGDELSPDDPSAFIATGFNRNWPYEDNNMVKGLNHQLMLEDMTDTTASVFLGITLACTHCHDHKYDPISQKDYYRFQALFAASTAQDNRALTDKFTAAIHQFVTAAHAEKVEYARRALEVVERPYVTTLLKDKLAKLPADLRKAFETEPEKRSAFQEDLLVKNAKLMAVDSKAMKAMMSAVELSAWESKTGEMRDLQKQKPAELPLASGMTDTGSQAPPVFLLRKGNFTQPDAEIPPGFPTIFGVSIIDFSSRAHSLTTGRRAALASWLTRPDHPLAARVIVNRIWQGHFGRGIVATPSDFGTMGARPSHPELLDWLATELISRGWSLKAMHRLMVTSATYRQSSIAPAQTLEEDPDNLLFGRMFRRRLEAEAVRDAMLFVSEQLNLAIGGPSVFPDLPPGVQTRGGWTRSEKASDRNRRSLYVFARRNLKYPLFDAFDAPDPNITCPERNISVNAPQALMLLNSEMVLEAAKALAEHVWKDVGHDDPAALVERAYWLTLGREPDLKEKDKAIRFLGTNGKSSGSLIDFCHALMNLNEFVFVD